MRLLLIRHGESSANAEGRLQGHLDFSLSERGRRESERLADRIEGLGAAALYTSPLRRAFETAQIVATRLALEPLERPALMERDVGDLAGLTREEIRARFPEYVRARAEARPADVPGFEADEPFAERALSALNSIIAAHPDQLIAVVTHGGVIGAFVRDALGMATVRPGPLSIDNASITTFETIEGDAPPGVPRARLIALNDTCHLNGLATERPR